MIGITRQSRFCCRRRRRNDDWLPLRFNRFYNCYCTRPTHSPNGRSLDLISFRSPYHDPTNSGDFMSPFRSLGQDQPLAGGLREAASRFLQVLIEVLLLVMVCFAPWAYGSIHSGFEFLLDFGVFLLSVLWAVRVLVEG